MPAGAALAELMQRGGVQKPKPLRLLEGGCEAARLDHLGEVEKSAGDSRHGDALAEGAVVRTKRANAVQCDSGTARTALAGYGHIDRAATHSHQLPKSSSASVTEMRFVTASQNGCHPARMADEAPVADCVNATM